MPHISIILPAYNAESFLEQAVNSVIAQSFSDWELIIIDDGSTDNTPELADAFSSKDKRIRVLHQTNSGVSESRNRGIDAAQGEYIAFLDADDSFEPEFLEKMRNAMIYHITDCAACGHLKVYPDGTEEPEPFPLPEGWHSSEAVKNGIVLPLLTGRLKSGLFNGFIWRFIFHRDTILSENIRFSGAYLEDELFLIEYFSHPRSLAVVGENLYRYLQNPASVTRRYLPSYVDTFLSSLAIKRSLVERFDIPVPPEWVHDTCWAGLVIAIANIYAPGNNASFDEKLGQLKGLLDCPEFAEAVKSYYPRGMNSKKALVVKLYRNRLYLPLGLLYTTKNRNRG